MTLLDRVWTNGRVLSVTGSVVVARRTLLKIAVLVFALYVFITLVTLVSTQRAADSVAETEIGSVLASGEAGLDELEERLAVFDRRLGLLKFWIFPARQVARVLVVVPPAERQRVAAELLLERVEIDSDTARASVGLARSILELRESVLAESISLSDLDELAELNDALVALKVESVGILAFLSLASVAGAEFDDQKPNGLLVSVGQRMTDQEVRLGQIAEFAGLLSDVLMADIALSQEMTTTFDELRKFSNGEISAGEINVLITDLASRFEITADWAAELVATAPAAVMATEYGELVLSLGDMNRLASGLIASLETVLDAVAGSFDSLPESEGSLFDEGSAVVETLQTLIDNEDEIARAVVAIRENVDALLELGESGSISFGALNDILDERVEPLLEISSIMTGAPRVTGEVFGIDGDTRNYLILGQTSDELRAAGGFTSSAWLLTFKSGRLIENEYIDIVTIEDLDSLDEYPDAYEPLQLHMDADRMYMRDVGWDPNFPTVGRLAADLFEIKQDLKVDGVISLTQWAFIDYVAALGGLQTESGIVEADDLLSMIETGTDEVGTGFLSSLFDSLLASMSGDVLKTNGVDVLKTTNSLFGSKDLIIYSQDPAIQSQIVDIGWAGEISNSRGDRLGIVDSNVGWNKVDRNIERSFTYQVDLSDLDRPQAELRLVYKNNSVIDDNFCDIQRHVGGKYHILLDGCYWNYIRVYVPVGAELEGGDDLPLEAGSIAARVGELLPGGRTVYQAYDDNGLNISGLLAVDPQELREVVFTYSLPSQVLRRSGGQVEYTLEVVVQAGTRGRDGVVRVVIPDGYEIVDAGNSARISSNLIEFVVNPDRDDMIRLTLREAS